MNNMPLKLREECANDKFYKQCCAHGYFCSCDGKIEFHHNMIYASKQVQEKFAILPLCQEHHKNEKYKILKNYLNWIMLNRASEDQLNKYSKAINYKREKERLNIIYGIPRFF